MPDDQLIGLRPIEVDQAGIGNDAAADIVADVEGVTDRTDCALQRTQRHHRAENVDELVVVGVEQRTGRRGQLDVARRIDRVDQQARCRGDVDAGVRARHQGLAARQSETQRLVVINAGGRVGDQTDAATRRLEDEITGVDRRTRRRFIDDRAPHLDPGLAGDVDVAEQSVAERGQIHGSDIRLRGNQHRRDIDVQPDAGGEVQRLLGDDRNDVRIAEIEEVRTLRRRDRHHRGFLRIGQIVQVDRDGPGIQGHGSQSLAEPLPRVERDNAASDVGFLDDRVGAGDGLQSARRQRERQFTLGPRRAVQKRRFLWPGDRVVEAGIVGRGVAADLCIQGEILRRAGRLIARDIDALLGQQGLFGGRGDVVEVRIERRAAIGLGLPDLPVGLVVRGPAGLEGQNRRILLGLVVCGAVDQTERIPIGQQLVEGPGVDRLDRIVVDDAPRRRQRHVAAQRCHRVEQHVAVGVAGPGRLLDIDVVGRRRRQTVVADKPAGRVDIAEMQG